MVSIRTKWMYGSGGAVYAAKEAAYTMFVLLFYTQVLGLSGTLTGLVISISLVFDAISDPLVGAWSDRLRAVLGRRRPFMIGGLVPAGLGFLGLFAPPEALGQSQFALAGWLLFWSLWVRIAVTFFAIPHLAQSTDITQDYHERSKVIGARMAVMFFVSVMLPAVALTTIFAEKDGIDGRFVGDRYFYYGLMSCLLVWVTGTVSCALKAPTPAVPAQSHSMVSAFVKTFTNRNFRFLLGYDIFATVSYGVIVSLNMLAWIYFWEFSAFEISLILAGPSLVAIGAVMATLNFWVHRYEKPKILRFALGMMMLNGVWLYPPRLLGWWPENGEPIILWMNLLFMFVFMYFFLLRAIMSQSIAADIADEHDYRTGHRQEGSFFAALNFSTKMASVLGPAYGGAVLDIIGLSRDMPPGSVPESVLNGLAGWYMVGAGAPLVVAFALTFGMLLTQTDITRMQIAVAKRTTNGNRSGL